MVFTIKNNIKAFFIHIMISFIALFTFMALDGAKPKWVSEEAAQRHHNNMMIAAVIVVAVSLFLYFYFSRILFSKQKSLFRNILSVSLPFIIGVFLWIISAIIDLNSPSGILLNSQLWQLYSLYNGYSLFIFYESRLNNPYIFLLASLIPIIPMTLGIKKGGGEK